MSLKSLLLGSAAAFVAVSGAQAADAIVVEPEPVEYVRVCDAYGAGWFFIPGTETCIKLSGDVRVQYEVAHSHEEQADETSQHDADYRGRFQVEAQNETEYGPLYSRIRFLGEASAGTGTGLGGGHNDTLSRSEGPGSGGVLVDYAEISLAGFHTGFGDNYWSRAGNYGFYEARYDGPYGFGNGLFFEYTATVAGLAVTVGVEDGFASGEAGAPDLYAGVVYASGGLYLAGLGYHDSSSDEFAYKVRADYDFGAFAVGGWHMSDDGNTDYVKGHAWGVTAAYDLASNMKLFGGYGQYDDMYFDGDQCLGAAAALNADCGANRSFSTYTVGLAWTPVNGLLIQPEYQAVWFDNDKLAGNSFNGTAAPTNYGQFSMRIVRSF